MARSKVKVVLDRTNFSDEVLKRAVKPVMDDVQEQVEGMAAVDPAIKVYRNEDTDRTNVVATETGKPVTITATAGGKNVTVPVTVTA